MWHNDAKARKFKVFVEEVLEHSDDPQNVFTPLALCDEVLSKVPSLDGKILVVSNLEFVYTLVRQYQVDPSRIYYLTPCQIKKQIAESILDPHNIFVYNNEVPTEEDVDNMKFDVVVGNPPYQAELKTLQKRLWMYFVDLAFEVTNNNGYVALVTPQNWAVDDKLYTKWFASHQPLTINMGECGRHFPSHIGTTFSYYIIQNTTPTNIDVTFITNDGEFKTQLPPTSIGSEPRAVTILNKVLNHSGRKMTEAVAPHTHYSYLKKGKISLTKTKEFKYPVLTAPASNNSDEKWVWGKTLCQYQQGPRLVAYTYAGGWRKMFVTDKVQTSHNFIHYPVNSIEQGEKLKCVMLSKLFLFVVTVRNSNRGIKAQTIRDLPVVDLSHSWTDEELYEHFGLTDEEIKLIEETIK